MSFNNGPESVGQLEAGSVRALAVTTASRATFLPDVPSMAEAVPGYDTEVWWGLLGPAGMPPDVVAKLSHDFVAALNTDSVKERLIKLGAIADRQFAGSNSTPRSTPTMTNGGRSSRPPASKPNEADAFGCRSGKARSSKSPGFPNRRSSINVRQQQARVLRQISAHEIYVDILRARPDVRLDRLENESPRRGLQRRSWPRRMSIRSAPRAMSSRRIFTPAGTCCGARRTS